MFYLSNNSFVAFCLCHISAATYDEIFQRKESPCKQFFSGAVFQWDGNIKTMHFVDNGCVRRIQRVLFKIAATTLWSSIEIERPFTVMRTLYLTERQSLLFIIFAFAMKILLPLQIILSMPSVNAAVIRTLVTQLLRCMKQQ